MYDGGHVRRCTARYCDAHRDGKPLILTELKQVICTGRPWYLHLIGGRQLGSPCAFE